MVKCCLISKEDCESLQNALYHKRNNLVVIENNVDKNSEKFSKEELEIFVDDCIGMFIFFLICLPFRFLFLLISYFTTIFLFLVALYYIFLGIRNNYCELLLSLIFYFHDDQIIKRIKLRKQFRNFENYRIFRSDLARKSFDFLQFVISDRKIQEKSLISRRSESIARNLIYFFSIRQDPSVKSFKLIEESQMDYFINDNRHPNLSQYDKDIENFVIEFKNQFRKNEDFYNLDEIFKNTEDLLEIISKILGKKLLYVKFY